MYKINIGTEIDLANLITSRMLIQANRGGGKSGLCRVIMEEAYGKVPFIMLDCDGEYYTLKEKLDDIIVIGGQYGDIAASLQGVTLLPREIVSNQLSVVIDLSDMKMNDRIRYVRLFLESLIELPNKLGLPYLVFLEEAHKFCGEQDKQESGPAVRDLMSRGRKMGFCGILVTQRISKLHKDAAAEVNNKFIGRTNLDIDMDRAAKELGLSNSSEYTRLSLRDLKIRHFYAYGTSITPHHVHIVTIKEAKTRFPVAGSIVELKPRKPTAKLLSMLDKLNELPKDQVKTERTVEELTKQVSKLQPELRTYTRPGQNAKAQVTQVPDEAAIQKRINQALVKAKSEFQADIKASLAKYNSINTNLKKALLLIKDTADNMLTQWEGLAPLTSIDINLIPTNGLMIPANTGPIGVGQSVEKMGFGRIGVPLGKVPNEINIPNNGAITKASQLKNEIDRQNKMQDRAPMTSIKSTSSGAMRILKACAMFDGQPTSKIRAALLARLSHKSGSFNTYISMLKSNGFIEVSGNLLKITDNGRMEAGPVEPLPTDPESVINMWCGILGNDNGASRILKELGFHYPNYVLKDHLANLTGMSHNSGSYNTYLSKLKSNGLITQDGKRIRAADELFKNTVHYL